MVNNRNSSVLVLRRMKWGITILFLSVLLQQDPWKDVYKESAWKDRDRWQRADELIRSLALKLESKVADVGCHEGYLTVKLAATVGSKGTVYAVDVEQRKLDNLKVNLEKREIRNVVAILGNYDDPKLPANTLDAVVILDTYHEMDEHDKMLQRIKESMKPGGRLVLCEAIAEERRKSPRADQERKHELGMEFAMADLAKAGFVIIKKQDSFVDRTKEKGDKMWLIVARK